MPDEKELFHPAGRPWSERASLSELDAVLTASGNRHRNEFLHHTNLFVAERALRLIPIKGNVVDFGCGTGRFVRFFALHAGTVLGTEITKEMLDQTVRLGLPDNCRLALTDGIRIPVKSATIDLIWVCSVLRFSLNVVNPVYDQVAREMYRALKPGGRVVNIEIYVEQPASDFTCDFEAAGFRTEAIRVINRHNGQVEHFAQSSRWPISLVSLAGRLVAWYRYHFDSPDAQKSGLRDYVFIWQKPKL